MLYAHFGPLRKVFDSDKNKADYNYENAGDRKIKCSNIDFVSIVSSQLGPLFKLFVLNEEARITISCELSKYIDWMTAWESLAFAFENVESSLALHFGKRILAIVDVNLRVLYLNYVDYEKVTIFVVWHNDLVDAWISSPSRHAA